MATLALVDDHILLRNGLSGLVKNLGHEVLFEADNGKDFIEKLKPRFLPQVVLMDINMPEKNGFETTQWLRKYHPEVKVLALSMYDDENVIIKMLRSGARGYILKDSDPSELDIAVKALMEKGFYYSDLVSGKLMKAIGSMDETDFLKPVKMSERETAFLKLICTELTYKDIADRMFVSPRTVDGYRDTLFEKLHLKTRVGLAVYAMKNGIVNI